MTTGEHLDQLNELTKEEFRDRTRHLVPDMSDEQFEKHWEEFQKQKAQRKLH